MSKMELTNPAVVETDDVKVVVRKHNTPTKIMHGCVAIGFILCGISGFMIWLGLTGEFGGLISHLHWTAGLLFFFAPVVYIIANFALFGRFVDDVTTYGKRDLGWLTAPFGGYIAEHLNLFRKNKKHPYVPPQDKYNSGQKGAALVLMFGSMILGVTGIVMAANGSSLIILSPGMTMLIWRIHLVVAIITFLTFCIHFYLSFIWPTNRKGEFKSMWGDGTAEYEFTAEEHGAWLNTLEVICEKEVPGEKPRD
ncbi:MAG: cytochrome b/b6 domain-containing protein [Anaerotardibacter sp.]